MFRSRCQVINLKKKQNQKRKVKNVKKVAPHLTKGKKSRCVINIVPNQKNVKHLI